MISVGVFLLLVSTIECTLPGAVLTLDQSAVDKIAKYLIPDFVDKIKEVKVPGSHNSHYSWGGIDLKASDIGSVTVTFKEPNVFIVHVNDVSVTLAKTSFSLKQKVPFHTFKCSGDFSGSVGNTNFIFTAPLTAKNGDPYTGTVHASAIVGDISVSDHFHHDCSILKYVGSVIGAFKTAISAMMKNAVPDVMVPLVKQLINTELAQLTETYNLNSFAALHYPLTSAPVVTGNGKYLTLYTGGYFADRRQTLPTLPRTPLPTVAPGSQDITFVISEFTFNTAFEVYAAEGQLNQGGTVPATTKILLPLNNACNNCPLTVQVTFSDPPKTTFNDSTAYFYIENVFAKVGAIAPNKTHVELFTTYVNATVGAKFSLNSTAGNTTLSASVTLTHFYAVPESSNVGPLPLQQLSPFIEYILNQKVVPVINNHTQSIPLPTVSDVTFQNPSLKIIEGALVVYSDVKFDGHLSSTRSKARVLGTESNLIA